MRTRVSVERSLKALVDQLAEAGESENEFRLTAGLISLQIAALEGNDPEKWLNRMADMAIDLATEMAEGMPGGELDEQEVSMMISSLAGRLKANGEVADKMSVILSGLAVAVALPKWVQWWDERAIEFGNVMTNGSLNAMMEAMESGDVPAVTLMIKKELDRFREELEGEHAGERGR